MTEDRHELWWDGDLISESGGWVRYKGFEVRVLSTDLDFGSPEPLTSTVASQLFDGDLVEVTGHGNREQSLQLQVRSTDGIGLALGEAMIVPKLGRRTDMKWVPPLRPVEPTIYEIVVSSLHGITNDVNELRGIRTFNVRLQAMPWVRSEHEVISYALDSSATSPTTVVVDSGVSATGWTGTIAGTAATVDAIGGIGVDVPAQRINRFLDPRFTNGAAWSALASGAKLTLTPWGVVDLSRRSNGAMQLSPTIGFSPSVTPGLPYTASVKLNSSDFIAAGGRMQLVWLNSTGGVISTAQSGAMGANPVGYATVIGTAPAGAARVQPRVALTAAIPAGVSSEATAQVTHALLEQASARGTYFDGDTPATSTAGFRWFGGRNASSSMQVPVGRIDLTRNGSIDFTTTPYLVVDYIAYHEPHTISALVSGAPVERIAFVQTAIATYRAVFSTPGAVASSIALSIGDPTKAVPGAFRIQRVARSDMPQAYLGTGRQTMRSMHVAGTVPTQGKLYLGHDTTALEKTHIYVGPDDGFQPPCSRFLNGGGTRSLDASTWSGARSVMNSLTPETFDIPMALLDAGSHSMWIRARATGTAGLREIVRTQMARIGSSSVGTASETTRIETMPTSWGIYQLGWGDATLTTIDPKTAPNGHWRVILVGNNIDLDELLIYNETTGSLLVVDCGSFNRLWVTNPSTDDPFPRIYVGTQADQSDARHIEMSAVGFFGKLNFLPGPQNVYTGSSAPNPGCEMRHPPHWHSHAGPIETQP